MQSRDDRKPLCFRKPRSGPHQLTPRAARPAGDGAQDPCTQMPFLLQRSREPCGSFQLCSACTGLAAGRPQQNTEPAGKGEIRCVVSGPSDHKHCKAEWFRSKLIIRRVPDLGHTGFLKTPLHSLGLSYYSKTTLLLPHKRLLASEQVSKLSYFPPSEKTHTLDSHCVNY